jgi:hypothetical protein
MIGRIQRVINRRGKQIWFLKCTSAGAAPVVHPLLLITAPEEHPFL